jgi:hypothetical protein
MHRAYLALVALAGVLALAFGGCVFQTNGIPAFSFDCPALDNLNVHVFPDGTTHYSYSGACKLDSGPRHLFTVDADWMPTHTGAPGSAFERITDLAQGPKVFASFWLKCSDADPWYTGTQCALDHHAGPLADGILELQPTFPVSSVVLTAAQRQQIVKAKDALKTQPCLPQDMFAVIATPGGNATYVNNIPVQVAPGRSGANCRTSSISSGSGTPPPDRRTQHG